MKIHSIRQRIGRRRRRLMAVCSAVLIGAAGSGSGWAQSPYGGAPPIAGSRPSSVSMQDGQLMRDGESFRVINSSSVPTAAGQAGVPVAPGEELIHVEGDPSALGWEAGQGGAVGSACSSCGNRCGGACGGGGAFGNLQGGQFAGAGVCGPVCEPFHYVTVEGLYMRQTEHDDFTLGNLQFDEFDYEWAPRVTIGSVPDCVNGCEVSFTGPIEWEMDGNFAPGGEYEAEYWSAEVNRTLVSWDALKLLYGVRYVDYEEDLRDLDVASLVENSMIGGQIGLDLMYPIAFRTSVDVRGRAGAYWNMADADVNSSIAGFDFDNDTEEDDLAGLFELGTGLRYNIGDFLTVRGGGELWYMAGMATAPGQRRTFGLETDTSDEILVIGLTASAELRF